MADKTFKQESDELKTDIWGERDTGMDMPAIDLNLPITHDDVLYLLNHRFPYLQLISSNPAWEETIVPRFLKARSGWIIHDYGQAMSVSPGRLIYGPGNPEVVAEEGGADTGGSSGRGTIIEQTFTTAEAMVQLAMDKGWPGVEIIAGTDLMKSSVWIVAQMAGYSLKGYEPSEKDTQKRDRVLRARESLRRMEGPSIAPRK